MANIDSQINDRMQMYSGNPQALQQRYAQTQELVDLLALQKMKNDRAAATSAVQGAMQTDTSTYKGQLEQEAMQGARSDVMRSMGPGIQQQGQRMAQMQNRAAVGMPTTGLPAQPAPNMRGMAMGGIVGYAQGGQPMMGPPEPNLYQRMGQGLKNYGANAQESMGILKAAKAGIGVPYEERSAVMKQVRDEIEAQNQNRDPNFIERMGQKLMDTGLNVEESKSILKKFYNNMGKTYEEMANPGMAMGGAIRGYAGGGEIRAYLSSIGRDIADFSQEQIAAISQMLDSQVARGQNDTLRGVGRGAIDVLRDRMPSGATSDAARDFNRETMQARNERDRSPSLTDQLNAAQRAINAENSASMQDVMTSPDNNMGIANILGGIRDFSAERDPRKSKMGRTIYDQAKKDLGNLGSMSDFAEGLGLNNLNDMVNRGVQSVRDSDFFSGVPSLEELYPALPEDSRGLYRVGRGINAAAMTIPKVVSGFLQPERGMTFADVAPMAQDLGRGILGVEQGTRTPTEVEQDQAKGKETASAGGGDIVEAVTTPTSTTPTSTVAERRLNSMAGIDDQALATALRAAMQTAEEKGVAGEKPKSELDLRPLREFLVGGAGQTSTAGALAGGARGLGAFQAAEQGRLDKIAQAGADRKMRQDLLREEYGFRDKELRSKLLSESMAGEREADRELLEKIMTSIESDPEFLRAAEEFKDTYDVFFGSYDKDKYAEALAKKRQELIEKRFNETKAQLAGVLGGSSASSAMDDLAKYGN